MAFLRSSIKGCSPKQASCGVANPQASCQDFRGLWPFPQHPVPSQRIPFDITRGQAKSNIKNKGRQPPVLKDQGECSGFVLRVSELIICREAAPRHQETANLSQKPTSASARSQTFRRFDGTECSYLNKVLKCYPSTHNLRSEIAEGAPYHLPLHRISCGSWNLRSHPILFIIQRGLGNVVQDWVAA